MDELVSVDQVLAERALAGPRSCSSQTYLQARRRRLASGELPLASGLGLIRSGTWTPFGYFINLCSTDDLAFGRCRFGLVII